MAFHNVFFSGFRRIYQLPLPILLYCDINLEYGISINLCLCIQSPPCGVSVHGHSFWVTFWDLQKVNIFGFPITHSVVSVSGHPFELNLFCWNYIVWKLDSWLRYFTGVFQVLQLLFRCLVWISDSFILYICALFATLFFNSSWWINKFDCGEDFHCLCLCLCMYVYTHTHGHI